LQSETEAKKKLADTSERERREAYFHRTTPAQNAVTSDNLPRALQFLGECPLDLRELHYLKRLCKVEPVILCDTTDVHSLAFSPDEGLAARAVELGHFAGLGHQQIATVLGIPSPR
jgi:hypothetical protein